MELGDEIHLFDTYWGHHDVFMGNMIWHTLGDRINIDLKNSIRFNYIYSLERYFGVQENIFKRFIERVL